MQKANALRPVTEQPPVRGHVCEVVLPSGKTFEVDVRCTRTASAEEFAEALAMARVMVVQPIEE